VKNEGKHKDWSGSHYELTIMDYLLIILRGKWIILVTCIVVLGGMILYTKSIQPQYVATSRILINTRLAEAPQFLNVVMGNARTLVMNELEILKSKQLAEHVAKKLLAKQFFDSVSKKPIRIVHQIDENGIRPELASVNQVVYRLIGSVDLEPTPGTDVIEITATSPDPQEAALIANAYGESAYELNLFTSRSKSRALREFLENQLAIRQAALKQAEDTLRRYMQLSGVVSLDQETSSLVRQIADLEARRDETEISLQSANKKLESYTEQLSQQEVNVAKVIGEANDPYITMLQEELARLEVQRDVTVAQNPLAVGQNIYNEQLNKLDNQISSLREKLRQRTTEFLQSVLPSGTGTGSDQRDPAGYLKQIKQQIIETQVEIQSLNARRKALDEALKQYENRFAKIPLTSIELARLQRVKLSNEELCDNLQQKFNDATINEQSQFGYIEFIDEASIPVSPAKPKVMLNIILGFGLGLGLGIVIVFIKERMDVRIYSTEELKREGYSVVGVIMRMDREVKILDKKSEVNQPESIVNNHLILITSPFSACAESYRHLRTNLLYAKRDESMKSILVTSSKPKEGKTTTTANIGVSFSQVGKKVLLIDADMRKPSLYKFFKAPDKPGLSDLLLGKVTADEVIKQTGIDNLEIINCGEIIPDTAEQLGSKKMQEFIREMKTKYDVIVIDSPPVLASTDASIIATLTETILVVTSFGYTRLKELNEAVELIVNVKGKLPAVVLNNFNLNRVYGMRYGYTGVGYYRTKK